MRRPDGVTVSHRPARRPRLSASLVWGGLLVAVAIPVAIAATSPYLNYRSALHIAAGFAGVLCLGLFLIQPLLAAGYLPGIDLAEARKWHRRVGAGIVALTALHVGGLFLTSPDDTLDALLLVAPTPFSVYGVLAMWGVVLTAVLVALRRRLGLSYPLWRLVHNGLVLAVVIGTIVHAVQIEGAMEIVSKWALCVVVLLATVVALLDRWVVSRTAWRASS